MFRNCMFRKFYLASFEKILPEDTREFLKKLKVSNCEIYWKYT